MFLHHVDVWLPFYMIEFVFVDGTVGCAHRQ